MTDQKEWAFTFRMWESMRMPISKHWPLSGLEGIQIWFDILLLFYSYYTNSAWNPGSCDAGGARPLEAGDRSEETPRRPRTKIKDVNTEQRPRPKTGTSGMRKLWMRPRTRTKGIDKGHRLCSKTGCPHFLQSAESWCTMTAPAQKMLHDPCSNKHSGNI